MKNIIAFFEHNKIIFYLSFIGILGYLCKYALNAFLSHNLAPFMLGQFNIGMRVLWIISSVAILGTNSAAIRFLSYYIDHGHQENVYNFIHWNMRVIRVPFMICIILAMATFCLMSGMHIWNIKEIRSYHIAVYMLIISPLYSLVILFGSYLFCLNHGLLNLFIQSIVYLLFALFFALFILFFNIEVSNYLFLFVLFSGYLSILTVKLIYIYHYAPFIFKAMLAPVNKQEMKSLLPNWLSMSVQQLFNGLLSSIIFSLDLLIVEFVYPGKDEAGLFVVALTIASILLVLPRNIYYLLKKNVFELISSDDGKQQLENQVRELNRISIVITLILVVGLLTVVNNLLLHYGSVYLEAKPTFLVLLLDFSITALSWPATSILAYAGFESSLLKLSVLQLVIILVLGIVLTHLFGIIGTATAMTCATLFTTFTSHITLYRTTKVRAYVF